MSKESEKALSPEHVSDDPELSREEKFEKLRDMEDELKRYATKNETSLDEVENKVAALNLAMEKLRKS